LPTEQIDALPPPPAAVAAEEGEEDARMSERRRGKRRAAATDEPAGETHYPGVGEVAAPAVGVSSHVTPAVGEEDGDSEGVGVGGDVNKRIIRDGDVDCHGDGESVSLYRLSVV